MEKKTNPILKNAMNFGLIGGAGMAIFRLFTSLGNVTFENISNFRLVILIAVIIYGTKYVRDNQLNNIMKYSSALRSGFQISFFSGIIFGFYVVLEMGYFFPDLIKELLITQEENMMILYANMDETTLEEMIELMHNMMSPMFVGFSEMFGTALWGGISSLILAIFLKKEDPFQGQITQIN